MHFYIYIILIRANFSAGDGGVGGGAQAGEGPGTAAAGQNAVGGEEIEMASLSLPVSPPVSDAADVPQQPHSR